MSNKITGLFDRWRLMAIREWAWAQFLREHVSPELVEADMILNQVELQEANEELERMAKELDDKIMGMGTDES